jgi:hypothetical protein
LKDRAGPLLTNRFIMFRPLFVLALLSSPFALHAQDAAPALLGRVEGRTYVSPTGAFKVTIPVMPELGGDISDTANVVTFQDDYSLHVSIAAFPEDATQRWELSTRGIKDYLSYFFMNYVMVDFKRNFQGAQIENATFNAAHMDGALTTFILIPGGSMFMDRVLQLNPNDPPPVAKRGNLVFVKNGYIYVISTELAERVTQGTAYKKTKAEEDQILRQRLDDVVSKMQFSKSAETKPASTTAK